MQTTQSNHFDESVTRNMSWNGVEYRQAAQRGFGCNFFVANSSIGSIKTVIRISTMTAGEAGGIGLFLVENLKTLPPGFTKLNPN